MNISNVYHSVSDYPAKIQREALVHEVSGFMSNLNQSHEERKKATDEINEQTFSVTS